MINARDVDHFRKEGFCICPELLGDAELQRLTDAIDAVTAGATLAKHDADRLEMEPSQAPDGTKVRRVYEPCTFYEEFRRFSESPDVLDSVEQLLGKDLLCTYSKINVKPAEIGSVVEWHQDMAYGPLTNSGSIALLLYLDDADRRNGCLQLLPGVSGMLDHSHESVFQGKITAPLDTSKAVLAEGKRGTAIFFSALTPHASSPNLSPRSRRTLILGYRAADSFPIYLGDMTAKGERYVRVVRGQTTRVARFDMQSVYMPNYPSAVRSLYELQEQSRGATVPAVMV